MANDIENHPIDSEYVCNRIPIPISVYRSLNDYHIYNHGPNPAETYRVSRACSNCIAPRYSWKKDEVFDCVDAAFVLNAILTPMDNTQEENSTNTEDVRIPEGYHVRSQGEEVPIEKWYFVRGDDNPRLRESLNDGLDYNIVIAIED